jgi:beta-phosphoglucomutase-like phosphatase (HAD superfamily)
VAIEDSPNGVLSAHRAGMRVIGVRTPYTAHLQLDGVERIVDSLCGLDLLAST